MWDRAGVWVWQPERFDPVSLGRLLRSNGFGWVTVQIHNGLGTEQGAKDALDRGWVDRIRAQGVAVGGWGVLGAAPEREANLADRLCYRWHLSHYIADAEAPHKGPEGDQHRSDVFVKHFRKLRPRLQAGFSTYGGAPAPYVLGHIDDDNRGPMHFRCWYRAGFILLPQAYPNEFGPVYEPLACVDHARRSGWPLGLMRLTVGVYGGWTGHDYIERLAACRHAGAPPGFSVFAAENMSDDDYRTLGTAIRERHLANATAL